MGSAHEVGRDRPAVAWALLVARVIVGAIFIAVNFVRSTMGHFSKKDHFAILAAGWYWHFVDVVWLLLFFVVLYVPLYMLKP